MLEPWATGRSGEGSDISNGTGDYSSASCGRNCVALDAVLGNRAVLMDGYILSIGICSYVRHGVVLIMCFM